MKLYIYILLVYLYSKLFENKISKLTKLRNRIEYQSILSSWKQYSKVIFEIITD